jgi:hypothetical protein
VGAADGVSGRLGQAEVLDLPGLDQILHGSGHLFDRHVGGDAVLAAEIEHLLGGKRRNKGYR